MFVEKYGVDVDEAVKLALLELNTTIDNVQVTVIQEPTKGFLGIGSKLAKVRVELNGLTNSKTQNASSENATESFTAGDTEYEAWLNSYHNHHLDFDTWKAMALGEYAEDPIEKFAQYEREMRPLWDEYYNGLKEIERDWSKLYNSKRYEGKFADMFETACLRNIELYKKMSQAEIEHGETPPPNAPAFKRLAMLYEKQGLYEEAVLVCRDALDSGAYGDKMANRFERMIKKLNRAPSADEQQLIDTYRM